METRSNFLKKVISLILLSTLATGCGQTGNSDENSGLEEQVTFDWYINYSWFSTGWGSNAVSRAITEKTGVNINFITPQGNEEEKLNALIKSGNLPDLITLGWWEPQVNEMIQKDMLYAINELADQYDPYFYQVCDQQAVSFYTQRDGNIYGYPCSSVTPQDVEENDNIGSNQTFLVRKDIYEAIGSPDMSTIEGFETAVKKAAQMFPEVNGKPLIPIGAHNFDDTGNVSFDKYMQNFLAVPYEKDGKLYDRNTDPEYIKWLKMFRRLNQQGYITTDVFTDKRIQMEEKIAEGRYFCMMYQYTDMSDQQKELYTKSPGRIYIAVDGPKNQKGDDHILPTNTASGWTITLISKNCKDPEKAIKFLDYMISEEGQKMVYLGVEGITYDIVDGKEVIKPEVLQLLNKDRATYDQIYGADDAYWMLQDNVMQLKWKTDYASPTSQLEKWTYKYATYTGQYDVIFPADTEDAYINSQIDSLWSATLQELLLAPTEQEFDEILENFKAEREELGFEQLQEKRYKYVLEAKNQLGID
ncbi:MAG: extracellular solute-binding protein [Pseudobutyrivibrio sp.]|nr:extracellular solute-binding protein [Pseudobutyrivibrio sp.]